MTPCKWQRTGRIGGTEASRFFSEGACEVEWECVNCAAVLWRGSSFTPPVRECRGTQDCGRPPRPAPVLMELDVD